VEDGDVFSVNLFRTGLDFLQAEDVGPLFLQPVESAFFQNGSQTVDIPGCDYKVCQREPAPSRRNFHQFQRHNGCTYHARPRMNAQHR
jgi:hypothetical protein